MQAILKSESKIIITGADSSEKILLENIVKEAENKTVKFETVLDINGDTTGCLISLEDSSTEE